MHGRSDRQLIAVLRAVLQLPVEERTAMLRRIVARLEPRANHSSNVELDNAVSVALRDLIEESGHLKHSAVIRWLTPPAETRAGRFRKCAEECIELSHYASEVAARNRYMTLAQHYRAAAETEERSANRNSTSPDGGR